MILLCFTRVIIVLLIVGFNEVQPVVALTNGTLKSEGGDSYSTQLDSTTA